MLQYWSIAYIDTIARIIIQRGTECQHALKYTFNGTGVYTYRELSYISSPTQIITLKEDNMTDKYTFHLLKEQFSLQRAERLAYIDFRLRFMGSINRSHITDLFGIADAAASNEISEYKKLRPENVDYMRVKRANVILRDTFVPLIDISSDKALGMLANGFNKNKLVDTPLIPYQRVGVFPKKLGPSLVSKITRSIHCQTAIRCIYLSGNSDNHGFRTLLPTAIFYDGHSWKFRAFHRENNTGRGVFKCFNFSRVIEVEELNDESAKELEKIENDEEWQLTVPIYLEVHPLLPANVQKRVKEDFGLSDDDNEMVVTERAALFYFLRKHWAIDINDSPTDDRFYNFYLKNTDDLKVHGFRL